jgi:hypothetical protein
MAKSRLLASKASNPSKISQKSIKIRERIHTRITI